MLVYTHSRSERSKPSKASMKPTQMGSQVILQEVASAVVGFIRVKK
jgi:hypothetical protein